MFSHDQHQTGYQGNMHKHMYVRSPQANNFETRYFTSRHNYVSDWNNLPVNHHGNQNIQQRSNEAETARRNERKRTENLNSAFDFLRNHIAGDPSKLRLSKINVLRRACAYIAYLTDMIWGTDFFNRFQDLNKCYGKNVVDFEDYVNTAITRKFGKIHQFLKKRQNPPNLTGITLRRKKKGKPRTGWPLEKKTAMKTSIAITPRKNQKVTMATSTVGVDQNNFNHNSNQSSVQSGSSFINENNAVTSDPNYYDVTNSYHYHPNNSFASNQTASGSSQASGDRFKYFQLQPISNQKNNEHQIQSHHVNAYYHDNQTNQASLPRVYTIQTNQPSLYHEAMGRSDPDPVNSYHDNDDDNLLNATFTSF